MKIFSTDSELRGVLMKHQWLLGHLEFPELFYRIGTEQATEELLDRSSMETCCCGGLMEMAFGRVLLLDQHGEEIGEVGIEMIPPAEMRWWKFWEDDTRAIHSERISDAIERLGVASAKARYILIEENEDSGYGIAKDLLLLKVPDGTSLPEMLAEKRKALDKKIDTAFA